MKKQTDKSIIGLVIGSTSFGLACILCAGMLTFNALDNAVTAHADALYSQQTELIQKYKTSIDDYNNRVARAATERVAREKVESNGGIALPKDKKTGSLDSLEAAGVGTSRVVKDTDGTFVYMIRPGDTLTKISEAFGYSVDEFANYNQIRNVNLIYANSALRVPKGK